MSVFSPADNRFTDKLITARKTTRAFAPAVPPTEVAEQLIAAGRQAPFASLTQIGTSDFRRFFVIRQGSGAMEEIQRMAYDNLPVMMAHLKPRMGAHPRMEAAYGRWQEQLKPAPLKGLSNAPWLIIVAERRGYPHFEEQCLAYVVANMWMKATVLSLAFQVVSHINLLGPEHPGLCGLLGLTPGEFAFEGVVFGYPPEGLPAREEERKTPELSITWLE